MVLFSLVNRDSDLKHLLLESPGIYKDIYHTNLQSTGERSSHLSFNFESCFPFSSSLSFFFFLFLLLLLCCPTFCLSAQAQAVVFSDDLSERSEEALFNEQVGCGTICPHVMYSSLQVWLLKGVS